MYNQSNNNPGNTERFQSPKEKQPASYTKLQQVLKRNANEVNKELEQSKDRKIILLEKTSVKLNIIRFFIRLMKESKSLDLKKYTLLQGIIDEIGRMLGGWIKSQK